METHLSNTESTAGRAPQIAAWVQLPRRVVLLIAAFAGAFLLLTFFRQWAPRQPDLAGRPFDWSLSAATGEPVSEIIGNGLVYSVTLLLVAFTLALLLVLFLVATAVTVHRLQARESSAAALLLGLGRLAAFAATALPAWALAFLLFNLFVVRWQLLPLLIDPATVGPGAIILPALALALWPALVTAQAVAHDWIPPGQAGTGYPRLVALFRALATLFGQTGGFLSAIVAVELVFGWPGFAQMTVRAAAARDYPLLFGVVTLFMIIVLAGRLAAELFGWLERISRASQTAAEGDAAVAPARPQRLWVGLALLLLLPPAGLVAVGLTVDVDAADRTSLADRLSAPSAAHPWGTDELGRDVRARVLRGALTTALPALAVSLILLLPAALIGGVAGSLARRRSWASESAADLLRLPLDVLLFFPLLPGAILLASVLGPGMGTVLVAVSILLLPRAVRAFQMMWMARPPVTTRRRHAPLSLAALLLATTYVAFGLVFTLDLWGWGGQSVLLPSLGMLLRSARTYIITGPWLVMSILTVVWLFAFGLYTAADAVIGFSHTKQTMARLNE
jgi:peptide/nickel transport system permease protein